jgi:site-specific DNA-methyltransferase (adenine-specific)
MTDKLNLHHGDCLEVLRSLPDCSVDSVVTDPPYGLSFMGKRWDYDVPSVEVWAECLRVLKPGGHLLAFAGTRTQHRMAVRIEDAGFEIRDMIAWVYGSGFPKSLDVSKAIDKAAGAEREVIGKMENPASSIYSQSENEMSRDVPITAPATPEAKQWQGWGTALKPALEPITVARKPLIGTVAENVLQHGTGAINVDGGRVVRDPDDVSGWSQSGSKASENRAMSGGNYARDAKPDADNRWPANFIHDGSEEATDLLGASARFFYCAKASKADRDEGCDKLQERSAGECVDRVEGSAGMESPRAGAGRTSGSRNHHPTVKPTDLMRYLCRLVTPPSGTVLDPFMGSGSTGKAAMLEGFAFVGIEREAEYIDIAKARIQSAVGLL